MIFMLWAGVWLSRGGGGCCLPPYFLQALNEKSCFAMAGAHPVHSRWGVGSTQLRVCFRRGVSFLLALIKFRATMKM